MTLQTRILLWDKSAEEKDYHSSLKSDENVDAAIIGGGFTGLSTASYCAEKGLSTQVLEVEKIGFVSANCFTVLSSGIYC